MKSLKKISYIKNLRKKIGNDLLMVPGVRAIIQNIDGSILLQKRRDLDIWGLPGGSPDEKESITDCLIREVKEETGLIVHEYVPIGFSSNPEIEVFRYPNGDIIHSYPLIFKITSY